MHHLFVGVRHGGVFCIKSQHFHTRVQNIRDLIGAKASHYIVMKWRAQEMRNVNILPTPYLQEHKHYRERHCYLGRGSLGLKR